MSDKPVDISDDEFEEKVLNAKIPVIVDFWAVWCGPCKMIEPVLRKVAEEQGDKILVAKINVDKDQEWASRYGVQGIPTTLFVYKGNILHRQVGAVPEPMFRTIVDQFINVTTKKVANA